MFSSEVIHSLISGKEKKKKDPSPNSKIRNRVSYVYVSHFRCNNKAVKESGILGEDVIAQSQSQILKIC